MVRDRRHFVCIASLILGLAASAPRVAATTVARLDTRELVRESHEIVIGEVRGTRSYWDAPRRRMLTDVSVRVTQRLKGRGGDTVVLTQLGGELDGVRVSVPGAPSFVVGEEALVFVWRDGRGRAQVDALGQGKFDLRADPTTGEKLVSRPLPGLAIHDLTTLEAAPPDRAVPKLYLRDFVRVIERAVAEDAGRQVRLEIAARGSRPGCGGRRSPGSAWLPGWG